MKISRENLSGSEFLAGKWLVQPAACRILNENKEMRLRPMQMNLLVMLAEHAGKVLLKNQILEKVWEARFVSESALTREIAELRQILGDNRERPEYIETIPKRGYRFIAPVKPGKSSAEPRLAVLLFSNLNRDPDLDYFSEGITDALITELGNINSLRVISRQSVLHYKNSDKCLPDIARELNVDSVVEGSVLHAGNHIRITAQLIQAEPEEHLWARDYDCEIGDALEVQAQVARAVAESIHASLTPQDIARLSRKIPGNPDTLRAYLKARFLIMTWNQADVQTGFQYLNEVIQKSPGFALAYELLASCLFALGFWGYLPPRVVYPQARAAAMKAVELDDLLCEAHATLGLANLVMDWDAAACERELERAVEINPSNDAVRLSCALYLVTMSRKREEALKQAKLGLEANPLSEHTNFSYAWILLFAGEYDSAREHALKTMDMYRNSLQLYFILGWAHLGRARVTDAVEAFEKAVAISRDTVGLGYLGHAYGLAGRRDEALAALQEMLERSEREEVPLTSLALIHIGLGDFDKALDLFDKCFEERDGRLFWLPLTIFCDTFCADPRYQQLLQRMKAAAERSSIA